MSIDINWSSLTSGDDGAAFAETVREFIHDRFQHVTLPRFIRSVQVHSFDFGTVPPELEVKDVCDPLPDFYEDDDEDDDAGDDEQKNIDTTLSETPERTEETSVDLARDAFPHNAPAQNVDTSQLTAASSRLPLRPGLINAAVGTSSRNPPRLETQLPFGGGGYSPVRSDSPEALSRRSSTPGIPGGTSNMSSFHLPFSTGLSGASTPLAAFGGPRFGTADHHAFLTKQNGERFMPAAASPIKQQPSLPTTRGPSPIAHRNPLSNPLAAPLEPHQPLQESPPEDTPGPNDVQVVLRATYAGDIRMVLTADILLDYPMTSFVGIPLKLTITGLQFDGVAILAYLKHKACFCFLSPEDADALVGEDNARNPTGGDDDDEVEETTSISPSEQRGEPAPTPSTTTTTTTATAPSQNTTSRRQSHDEKAQQQPPPPPLSKNNSNTNTRTARTIGNLLEDMRIESEIGEKSGGKQVLKNVGKVEKFVLEQVRHIFEQEFVYPSFWTFLV